jgi:membrane protease YdiL (CAAX protease family)
MLKFILNPEKTVFGKIRNIGFVFTINIIWICFIVTFLHKLDPDGIMSAFPQRMDIGDTPASLFFFACIMAPLWEEAAFRYAPITIAKNFGEQYLLPVIVISSVLFGWGHGFGPISLLIQGVAGFLFSLLYIKNNYSYLSTVVSHFLWNLTLIFLVPILAGT